MKNVKYLLILCIACTLLLPSCSSDDVTPPPVADTPDDTPTDDTPTDDDDTTDDDTMDDDDTDSDTQTSGNVAVLFPDGTDIDFTGLTVTSVGQVVPLNADGGVELPFFDDANELAFVTNAEGNILLAGFVSEARTELSVASTAAVLFYFSSTGYLQQENSKAALLDDIEENPAYQQFATSLEDLFVQDNLVLQNGGFMEALQAGVQAVGSVTTISNAVFVESNDVRSQLQLTNSSETAANSFSVTNSAPRRAEVFVYKTAFVDMDGNRQVIDNEISGGDIADYTEPLAEGNFREGFNNPNISEGSRFAASFTCNLAIGSINSPSFPLELEDNESVAEFEVRIIGPGQQEEQREMTAAERTAFERIAREAFLLDYVLPTLFDIGGRKEAYDSLGADFDNSNLLSIGESFLTPQVEAMIFAGEYQTALEAFFDGLIANTNLTDFLERSYEEVFNNTDLTFDFVFTPELDENLVNIVSIIENVTSLLSFICTENALEDIRRLESWDLTADRGEVSLEPLSASVPTFDNRLVITADIAGLEEEELNDGSITYQWSVTENFESFLSDTEGNSGINIINNTNTVRFVSFAGADDLTGVDENLETVTVQAFRDNNGTQQLVGTAEMTVNVLDRTFDYAITPRIPILMGNQQVNLQVIDQESGNVITSNEDFEIQVRWSTPGPYGLFNGNSSSETVSDNGNILFRNLDDEVDNARQQVRAGIWLRPRDNPQNIGFREVGFAFTDIFISNDPETIVLELDSQAYFFPNPEPLPDGRFRQFIRGGFIIPRNERALSYSLEVLEFLAPNGVTPSPQTGRVFTWDNDAEPDTFLRIFGEELGNTGFIERPGSGKGSFGDFSLVLIGGSVGPIGSTFDSSYAGIQRTRGRAIVTITLAPE